MRKKISSHRQTQGFTLIEVLVSVLILSFGMLGLVGMQAFALQSNREARLYSQGINYARELAEMMRGNNQVSIARLAADNPYLTDSLTPPDNTCLTVGSDACDTAKDVAEAQMHDWLSRLDAALPGARVAVCFDSAPYDATTGQPVWDCTAGSTGNEEIAVIKIGWTMRDLDTSQNDANALVRAANNPPQIVIPVTGGNPFDLAS